MKSKIVSALALAGLVLASALSAGGAPGITGRWVGNLALNDGGLDPLTMIITKHDEGYAGTIHDEMYLMPEGTELHDIVLNDSALTFTVMTAATVTINITLTVGQDSMIGSWQDPSNETGGDIKLNRWK